MRETSKGEGEEERDGKGRAGSKKKDRRDVERRRMKEGRKRSKSLVHVYYWSRISKIFNMHHCDISQKAKTP